MKIETYKQFAEWHKKTHGTSYRNPTKDECIADRKTYQRTYDEETDSFYYYTGQYHPTNPGELRQELWQSVADHYDSMYSSFSHYGTN